MEAEMEELGEVDELVSSSSQSLMEELRAKRQQLQEERELLIDIPGYEGLLVGVYQPLTWDKLRAIAETVEKNERKTKSKRAELMGQIDTIASACKEVRVREGGKLKSIGEGVRYDDELAEFMGLDATKARQVVHGLFVNELAITGHYNELVEWMQETDQEVNDDFLGES